MQFTYTLGFPYEPDDAEEVTAKPVDVVITTSPAKKPTQARRVLDRYRTMDDKSRAWAVALCKTSLALPFESIYGVIWLFDDRSGLVMDAETGHLSDSVMDASETFLDVLNRLPDSFEQNHTRIFL